MLFQNIKADMFLSSNILYRQNLRKGSTCIALEAKVRTLLNAEIQSGITSDFLLARSTILRLLYRAIGSNGTKTYAKAVSTTIQGLQLLNFSVLNFRI